MRLKLNRIKIVAEYELQNGEIIKIEYFEPTTQMIDTATEIEIGDTKAQLQHVKETLRECLRGDAEKIDAIIDEQTREGNLYEFKAALDVELGKLRKRR